MSVDVEKLTKHDLTDECPVCRAQEVSIHAKQLRSPLFEQHPTPSRNQHSNLFPHFPEARQG